MTQTIFADISYFQNVVNNNYPYHFLCFRSNDGTFKDPHFKSNLNWAINAVETGKMTGFMVYFVWRPDWQAAVKTLKEQVGTPHPKMAIMIDVESWGGKIKGNQSLAINMTREILIRWLGGNRKRVIGYGNAYDLKALWPDSNDTKFSVANYSTDPVYPNKIIHQFSDRYEISPFGKCDGNLFEGTPQELAVALGLLNSDTVPPSKETNSDPLGDQDMYLIVQDSANGATALVGANVWQPLNYGADPVTNDDIKILLRIPLCANPKNDKNEKAIMLVSPARFGVLKKKVAGK